MNNSYPEKPVLPYQKTTVSMTDVVRSLAAMNVPAAVKRAAYCIFRFESANGKSGVNQNYGGMQADGSRWPAAYDHLITGTCVKAENSTGKERRFLCFASVNDFLKMYVDRLMKRGLYVGGKTHLKVEMNVFTEGDLVKAYEKDWVQGNKSAEPSAEKTKNFLSMYKQAKALFL